MGASHKIPVIPSPFCIEWNLVFGVIRVIYSMFYIIFTFNFLAFEFAPRWPSGRRNFCNGGTTLLLRAFVWLTLAIDFIERNPARLEYAMLYLNWMLMAKCAISLLICSSMRDLCQLICGSKIYRRDVLFRSICFQPKNIDIDFFNTCSLMRTSSTTTWITTNPSLSILEFLFTSEMTRKEL